MRLQDRDGISRCDIEACFSSRCGEGSFKLMDWVGKYISGPYCGKQCQSGELHGRAGLVRYWREIK
jgi:hypothetical protein